jgi:hypothetical protein
MGKPQGKYYLENSMGGFSSLSYDARAALGSLAGYKLLRAGIIED